MYLAEDHWRNRARVRNDIDVIYNTALPRIFGVEKVRVGAHRAASRL